MAVRHLTPRGIAELVACSEQTILTFIDRGELKATNWGQGSRPRWKIAPSDFQAFLDRRSNQQEPKPTRARRVKPIKQFV